MPEPRLTDQQRRALHLTAHKGGAHRAHTRRNIPRDQIHPLTADNLVALGYVTQHGQVLLATKTGRAALTAPIPEPPPVWLHQRDGLTTHLSAAVFEAGEVIDPDTLSTYWTERSLRRRAAAQDRRTAARRLRNQAKTNPNEEAA